LKNKDGRKLNENTRSGKTFMEFPKNFHGIPTMYSIGQPRNFRQSNGSVKIFIHVIESFFDPRLLYEICLFAKAAETLSGHTKVKKVL